MDGIGSVTTDPSRIDEMLRRAAEDAGQQPLAHYRGLDATMSEKTASLEGDKNRSPGSAGAEVGGLLAAEAAETKGTTVLEAAADAAVANATRWAGVLRVATASSAIVEAIAMGYELMDDGFIRAHAHGDAIRDAAANDAMMVGVTQALAMPAGFKAAVARMRPETATQGGAAVAAQFAGRDAAQVPVLQYNADAGLTAARPWAERVAATKTPDAQKRILEDFIKSPELTRNDNAAYGLGVAEAMWAAGATARGELSADRYSAIFNDAHARMDALVPPRRLTP